MLQLEDFKKALSTNGVSNRMMEVIKKLDHLVIALFL